MEAEESPRMKFVANKPVMRESERGHSLEINQIDVIYNHVFNKV